MALQYEISNQDHSVTAVIYPAHGGMVGQLLFQNHPVLHLDEKVLETAPMAAGGMPLLFPFPSKTAGDSYVIDGRTYHMPMHGLLKNAAFALRERTPSSVTLWMESNAVWKEQYYPFDFGMELCYEVTAHGLLVTVQIENRSNTVMPHCLGFHPFFYVSDKKNVFLEHSMKEHYDYVHHSRSPAKRMLDLSTWLDDVFCVPQTCSFRFDNPSDQYHVSCRYDEAFQTLVVCSWVPESMCIEPWCGVPDAINCNYTMQKLLPGTKKTYQMSLEFSA